MVLDSTMQVICREKINVALVEENVLGAEIRSIEALTHVIRRQLLNDNYGAKIQRNFAALDKRFFERNSRHWLKRL
jgi:hypothetical protein